MKQRIISSTRQLLEDRSLTVLISVFLLGCIVLLIYLAAVIRPSELQVVVHYSSFGATNFYRDKWYYLLTFSVFVVLLALSHTLIAYRLLIAKGREFAIAFVWLGITVLIVAAALFYQILKVASLS
jgi:uncharacterized membrane protein